MSSSSSAVTHRKSTWNSIWGMFGVGGCARRSSNPPPPGRSPRSRRQRRRIRKFHRVGKSIAASRWWKRVSGSGRELFSGDGGTAAASAD
ncbi:hypothetical protein GWI33_001937 [Rhynchophorus ferrugineus]|uniref:Uncharacterized protein n=1 Tax=Rhynchophorus ferrugineus TaxID=354439 RepID=A0A834IKS7_RHYFE|nr:hypothetical protein GWI33_001937 [Rhynchophorus ferrugineus]